MIGRALAAAIAARAGNDTGQLSATFAPGRHKPPPAGTRCLSCYGSGFETGATGVCDTDTDCPTCDGTGNRTTKPADTDDDGRGSE